MTVTARWCIVIHPQAINDADADREAATSVVAWLNSWTPSSYEGRRVTSDTGDGCALLDRLDAARLRLRDRIAEQAGIAEPGELVWEDDL